MKYADLMGAYLRNADLETSDLRGSDRWPVIQPDGFQSLREEKHLEHLKLPNIEGLKT